MPQTVSNTLRQGRGRGRHEYMKPNGVVNDHTPATTWLNGACVNRAFPAVVNPPAGVVSGAEPCSRANGAWPAVHMGVTAPFPHTAGVVNGHSVPDGGLANGTIALGTIGLPNGSGLAAPEKTDCEASSVQKKDGRRGKKWKRNKAVVYTPLPPPEVVEEEEEEDWEAEIVEAPPLRLHLKQGKTSHWTNGPEEKLTGVYNPAKHHRRPIKWSCYKVPAEPGQFADANE